jgi:hypothetical protein
MRITVAVLNAKEMAKGFTLATVLSQRYERSELTRGGKRVVKAFKKTYLSGSPGIKGGQFKKGKHVFSFPRFGKIDDVAVGISRILRTHEEGATIPAHGTALYLSEKTGIAGKGKIFAVVPKVKIPARTRFRLMVREMAPDIAAKVGHANVRGIQHAMDQTLGKTISRL